MKPKVLFVCVENSCRSQMAEGFARALGQHDIDAWSAGSKPSGRINPRAIELMKEKQIDLQLQSSKGLTDVPEGPWDYVVTMGCGDACPIVPSKRREDWEIPDPKNMTVDDFRKVRDQIEAKVKTLIAEVKDSAQRRTS